MNPSNACSFQIAFGLSIMLVLTAPAESATITVSACNGSNDQSKIQSAVDSASDGDTVQIQAGNCIFSGSVKWTNKNITVMGAGQGVSLITSNNQPAFQVTTTTKAGWRISGLTCNANNLPSGSGLFLVNSYNTSSSPPGRFRIDHITSLISGGANNPKFALVEGMAFGLIDHVTVSYALSVVVPNAIAVLGHVAGDEVADGLDGKVSVEQIPLGLGTDLAVYVEDSTFSLPFGGYGGINDSTYGGRMVWRYNKFSGPWHLQTHATRGAEHGGLKSEYYNNIHDALHDPGYPGTANMRSGTGVFFNNAVINNDHPSSWLKAYGLVLDFQRCPSGDSGCNVAASPLGSCSATSGFDGGIESNGWPCLDQPGTGGGKFRNQLNVPVYLWNNGTSTGCATGGTCPNNLNTVYVNCGVSLQPYVKTTSHSNGAKDFCAGGATMPTSCGTHVNTYRPYTYPHPLQSAPSSGGNIPPPPPPTNLQVSGISSHIELG